MLTGDALAVQLFVASLCPAALLAALPLSGASQGRLRRGLMVCGLIAGMSALVWAPLVSAFPALGATLGGYLSGSWAALALLMATFMATAYAFLRRIETAAILQRVQDGPKEAPGPAIFKEAFVWAGAASHMLAPRFTGTAASRMDRLRLYVEASCFIGGLGGGHGWTKPEPLLIADLTDIMRGQTISVSLVSSFDFDGNIRWRWGPDNKCGDDPRFHCFSDRDYRGRVIAVADGFAEHEVFFASVGSPVTGAPILFGEQLFAFARAPT